MTFSTPLRVVFHLFAPLAEFERDLIRERTNAGLAAAKAQGRIGGRAPLDPVKITAIQTLKANAIIQTQVCKALGISRATF